MNLRAREKEKMTKTSTAARGEKRGPTAKSGYIFKRKGEREGRGGKADTHRKGERKKAQVLKTYQRNQADANACYKMGSPSSTGKRETNKVTFTLTGRQAEKAVQGHMAENGKKPMNSPCKGKNQTILYGSGTWGPGPPKAGTEGKREYMNERGLKATEKKEELARSVGLFQLVHFIKEEETGRKRLGGKL